METIESTNNKIIKKIGLIKTVYNQLRHIFQIFDKLKIKYENVLLDNEIFANIFLSEIVNLENDYYADIVIIREKYYESEMNSADVELAEEYNKIVMIGNYDSKINTHILNCQKAILCTKMIGGGSDINIILENVIKTLKLAESLRIFGKEGGDDAEYCHCGGKFEYFTNVEMKCSGCGNIKKFSGVDFDFHECVSGDLKNNTTQANDTLRHFKMWLTKIQARENKTFPPDLITRIEYIITRDNIKLDNVYKMRKILREIKGSTHNDNAPLLMVRFTGVSPPHLTAEQTQRYCDKFLKVVAVLPKVHGTEHSKPYYPYWIRQFTIDEIEAAKIAGDHVTAANLKLLLNYIHLQSEDTIKKNDKLYAEICKHEPSLVFRLTDVHFSF